MTNVNIQTEHIIASSGRQNYRKKIALLLKNKCWIHLNYGKRSVISVLSVTPARCYICKKKIDVDNHWKMYREPCRKTDSDKRSVAIFRYTAAILLIPALISSIYFYQRIYRLENQPIEQVELSSAYGLVSKITLPDGSEVWLNSGSKLHYPKQFVGDHRKVYLSGEAYFKGFIR